MVHRGRPRIAADRVPWAATSPSPTRASTARPVAGEPSALTRSARPTGLAPIIRPASTAAGVSPAAQPIQPTRLLMGPLRALGSDENLGRRGMAQEIDRARRQAVSAGLEDDDEIADFRQRQRRLVGQEI